MFASDIELERVHVCAQPNTNICVQLLQTGRYGNMINDNLSKSNPILNYEGLFHIVITSKHFSKECCITKNAVLAIKMLLSFKFDDPIL